MGLEEEWGQARQWVAGAMEPAQDRYVNVFETTIRVVGGLLGAFHLSKDELFLHRAVRSRGRKQLIHTYIHTTSHLSPRQNWAPG